MARALDAIIAVEGLEKTFRVHTARRTLYRTLREFARHGWQPTPRRRVLSEITLSVAPGERLALIGNNGAGKSTLLRLIAGNLRPTRGTVALRGERVLITSLGGGMIDDVSLIDNAILYGALYGVDPRRMRASFGEILDWAGLVGQEYEKLRTLSSGMRARLAFAIVRHIATDVFLVDEALSAGDATFRDKCRAFFDGPSNVDRTFVVATHDMKFAQSFCQRALWLDRGRIAGLGDSESVVAAYLAAQGRPGPMAGPLVAAG